MADPAGIQVLHVDDEPDLVELAADMLEREDSRFSVETATSASKGMDRLSATDFDCIVCDYDMPGQNGIEFLAAIRDQSPDLPFILYTGKGSEEVASGAISAGVTDYLQKDTGSEQYKILANRIVNAVENYRATQHIERQNDLFRKAQDIATVGAWEYDIETETAYSSEAVLEIHGLSPAENINIEKSLEYYHPDDRPIIRTAFQQAIKEGEAYDLELRLIDDDGNERWVRTRGEPQYKDGDPIRVRGVIKDITDQKERERELQELYERLDLAVEGAELGVWDWDLTTDEVEFNEQWAQMLGHSLDEIEPHLDAWEKRVHPSDIDEVEAVLDAHIAGEVDYYDSEHRMRTAEGDWMWIRDVGKVFERNEDGDPVRAVGIHINIDDRKQAAISLEQDRERLEFLETLENELIELSTDFLRIEGRDIDTLIDDALETLGRLVEADRSYVFNINHEAETLSNTHEWCAAGVGPQIDMLQDLPQDTLPWWMQKLGNFENVTIPKVAELPPEAEAEQEILQEQNIESLIVTPMISQDELVGFIGFDWLEEQEVWSDDLIDILRLTSELVTSAHRRHSRRQKLEEQRDNLEVLNQVVRHDIRNHMNIVSARADLLEEHVEEAGKENIEAIQDSAESATELTKTARDLSDIMLSSEEDVEPVRLDQYLDSVIENVRERFDTAVITIEDQIPETQVRGNELLEAVFRNLIHNAVVHNDKQKPEVRISTRIDEETITVRVADNGPGIPDNEKEAIFGKGKKGLDSPGTGVGLYLVETLVEQYGGDVGVEDNDPESSVFFVELPLTEESVTE